MFAMIASLALHPRSKKRIARNFASSLPECKTAFRLDLRDFSKTGASHESTNGVWCQRVDYQRLVTEPSAWSVKNYSVVNLVEM